MAALIETFRKLALALPGVTEKLSHGEPAFFNKVGMFAMADQNHHGSGHTAVWLNAPDGAAQSLVAGDAKHFFIPPYLGKSGWVGVRLDSGLPWDVVRELAAQAYETTMARRRKAKSRL